MFKILLFISSFFLLMCNVLGQNTNWQKLPFKLNGCPYYFYNDSLTDKLFISGDFSKIDSSSGDLFIWDGNKVSFIKQYDSFAFYPLMIVHRYNGKLYLGGYGLYVLTDTILLKLDTNGNRNVINFFYEYDNHLLVGGGFGNFTYPNKQYPPVSIIDSNQWTPLYGIDTVFKKETARLGSIITYKNELYLGGNINNLGTKKEILRWNGSEWKDVGGGIPGIGDEWIMDMEIYKGELYVAGRFLRATGAIDNNIVRWDGVKWKPVGGGVLGTQINKMQVFNNELWVVGSFYSAGGVPADNIAKWDGTKWCSIGSKFDNTLISLGVYKNELYMGGGFWSIDGDSSLTQMVKWIGGNYTSNCGAVDYTGIDERDKMIKHITIAPNPVQDKLKISYINPDKNYQNITVGIYNSIGQKVYNIEEVFSENFYEVNLRSLSPGIYYCEVELCDEIIRQKIVKY